MYFRSLDLISYYALSILINNRFNLLNIGATIKYNGCAFYFVIVLYMNNYKVMFL